MDNFIEDKVDLEILSNQLKVMAGFGKDGEKGFDGAVTTLMMQLYLCNSDFRKRKNKKGQEYGWNVAAYCAPEHLWGYDTVTALYKEGAEMNIQIFGTKKCNDTKKAERFFKERGIKYQFIDMKEKGMSKGEFTSVAQANGGIENMINWEGKDQDTLALIKYIADEDKLEKILENPSVIKTPVVRNGKQSTLGYQPEVWKGWS